MEGFNDEIGQKLKAAIRAKLMELGLYVDDQLPNYIMVMITNGRNKKEMEKELQLFLGDDTAQFTNWLHSVWNKLEQVTQPSSKPSRKRTNENEKKKKKRKKNNSSDSDSDTDKKKKIKASVHESDNKNITKIDLDGNSDDSVDENLHIGVDRYLSSRSDKFSRDISPDTTTSGKAATKATDKIENQEKFRSNTSRETEDDDDFLNLGEEDMDDFLKEGDDSSATVNNKPKISIETEVKKPEKVQSTSVSNAVKYSRFDKKSPVRRTIISNVSEKNPISHSLKAKLIKQNAVKPVQNSELQLSNKALSHHDNKGGKLLLEINLAGKKSSTASAVSMKSSVASSLRTDPAATEKRVSLEDDSLLDAREFINRKRGIVRNEKHSPHKEDSGNSNNVVVGNLQQSASINNNEKDSGSSDSVGKVMRAGERGLHDKHADLKKHDSIDLVDDKYNKRGKYMVPGGGKLASKHSGNNSADEKSKTENVRGAGKHFIHSENEIIRIKRVITNKKRYSSDEENYEDTKRIERKHILPSDSNSEESDRKRKKVDSMATLPVKVSRPRSSPTGSANGNLVRKAFEEVQRSLSRKEKGAVRLKRGSKIDVHGSSKAEKSAKRTSPVIHEIKEKHSSPEYAAKYEQQQRHTSPQLQQQAKQNNTSNSHLSQSANYSEEDYISYEPSQKVTKPLQKSSENQSRPIKDTMFQRVVNMARSAARQNQPVEEYDPENTSPQFVVTLTGLDPNIYPNSADNTDEIMASNQITNNISGELIDVVEKKLPSFKKLERCRYWPNCLNADCIYAHPTVPCGMFPNCKFGNSCLYIHPQCKFDLMCTRYDCPFTHSETPPAHFPPPAAPAAKSTGYKVSMPCKFFPNCVNPVCPYQHVKMCRFDKFCTNRSCTFAHTSKNNMLTTDKLKWINPQLQNSNANNAASSTLVAANSPPAAEQSAPGTDVHVANAASADENNKFAAAIETSELAV